MLVSLNSFFVEMQSCPEREDFVKEKKISSLVRSQNRKSKWNPSRNHEKVVFCVSKD